MQHLYKGFHPMKRSLYALIGALSTTLTTIGYHTPHFYRANYFFGEPRLEKNWLGTIDLDFEGGSTKKGRDLNHKKSELLDIYGDYNMHVLGNGVPNKDLSTVEDAILEALSLVPGRDNFGHLSFSGQFRTFEGSLTLTQNIKRGFFFEFNVPFSYLKISDVTFKDLSPTDDIFPNINTVEWQAFLTAFDSILTKHDLSKDDTSSFGLSDVGFLFGWTQNYEDTEVLDFVDSTIKFGILTPTGKKKDETKVFSLNHGYEGHFGFPLSFDLGFGAYEWLTIGGHFEAILFLDTTKEIRMQTDINQSGMIKLAQGKTTITRRANWEAGGYLKGDHVYKGFSLIFAYSYASQNKQKLDAKDKTVFLKDIINEDPMIKGFSMHTINFIGEYDFTKEGHKIGPRLSIFYNVQVGGKQTFDTNIFGGTFGIDIDWAL